MKKAILAEKVGMTQIFGENGVLTPVTVLKAGPCTVTQVKTVENDGYEAVQVGFGEKKEKVVTKDGSGKKVIRNAHGATKAEVGHVKKAGTTPKQFIKEFRFDNVADYTVGESTITVDIFAEGDKVDVTARSKGKGYAGGLKRHGLKSGPSGHGSKYHRHAGSNGSATTPGRVMKGKKMPGHMGCEQVTVQNLEIVKVDAENSVILVKGSVPGPKKSLVVIKETVKGN
ncbi:50S ribosomal protein L3 [Eubacterium ruminantium]|jgi:large subunit ribosomal protein L3|uniref:Large ribosomal subunit protein uL3 n=1 Tax=Eubacterium ruminantium TaxID=42322 RepID=A0A1T4NLW3_9FIRM|nr:50S ribosomal protein L3 [Eubacterium ruminantium]SCW54182.1 large subunit ribosomal protein L3 [Eubacterium ruminantium]SDM89477.1 large subunit ribosomal protein L3 [Eubacterium ruminantium]SJZ80270.1 large subunit ribosomal protein L3 [Eubacterium ruminantium]